MGNNTQIPAKVYFASPTLQDLVKNPDLLQNPWCSNAFASTNTILEFPENPEVKRGAFKTAFKAYSSEPLFTTVTRVVCLKQVYYLGKDGTVKTSKIGKQV